MTCIPPKFRAGQHDFDGRCDPSNANEAFLWQRSFSVGVFEYVLKKDLTELKRGPVKVRVSGSVGAAKAVYERARQIRDELDRGVYRGPKRVTVRKLSDAEIETAYDQAADMAVLQGTQVRAG